LRLLKPWEGSRSDWLRYLGSSALIDSPSTFPSLVTAAGPSSVDHLASLLLLEGRLSVIVVIVAVSAVPLHRGRNHDTLRQVSFRLESHHIRSVLDNFNLPIGIDIAIFSLDCTISKPRLQLECSVRGLVAVGVGAVIIQFVNLFEDGYVCGGFRPLAAARSSGWWRLP